MAAGKTVPVLTRGPESLWWKVLRGDPRVPWPRPSSDGQHLEVLEVEVGPAQLEVVVVVTEVTIKNSQQYKMLCFSYYFVPFVPVSFIPVSFIADTCFLDLLRPLLKLLP